MNIEKTSDGLVRANLKRLIDLYYEIRNEPHETNPFISWYGELEKEIVDMFCRWYSQDLEDAITKANNYFVDDTGEWGEFDHYSYKNGFIISINRGSNLRHYDIRQTESLQKLEEKYDKMY